VSDPGIRMKDPAHPGNFIRREIIEEMELNVTESAGVLGVTGPASSNLLNEKRTCRRKWPCASKKRSGWR
jgi:plasmid maintenance system antidote protein VapI